MTARELFSEIYPVQDPRLKEELVACTRIKRIKKHMLLNRQNEMDSEICFLKSGIVGTCEVYFDGKRNFLCFCDRPGEVIVGGMGPNNMQSMVDIVMLTDVELFSIRYDHMDRLKKTYPEVTVFYNRILIEEYLIQWDSKRMLYMDKPEDRYAWFLKTHPGAVDIVNHKVIASFLHMSPVTLSRLRHRKN